MLLLVAKIPPPPADSHLNKKVVNTIKIDKSEVKTFIDKLHAAPLNERTALIEAFEKEYGITFKTYSDFQTKKTDTYKNQTPFLTTEGDPVDPEEAAKRKKTVDLLKINTMYYGDHTSFDPTSLYDPLPSPLQELVEWPVVSNYFGFWYVNATDMLTVTIEQPIFEEPYRHLDISPLYTSFVGVHFGLIEWEEKAHTVSYTKNDCVHPVGIVTVKGQLNNNYFNPQVMQNSCTIRIQGM